MSKPISSVLRYAGGKQKLTKEIIARFPTGCTTYVEPMVGGASIFLAVRQRNLFQQYVISDAYKSLINFWLVCSRKRDCMNLVSRLKELHEQMQSANNETKRNIWNLIRNELPKDLSFATSPLQQAMRFFFLNRCSFSGTTEAGGLSLSATKDRFTISSILKLQELHNRNIWEGVEIDCADWNELNQDSYYESDDCFVMLDPPYMTAKKLYGPNGALHEFNHEELADTLKCDFFKAKFLMTLDDCPKVRELYKWANTEPISVQYSMVGQDEEGKRRRGSELFISNY